MKRVDAYYTNDFGDRLSASTEESEDGAFVRFSDLEGAADDFVRLSTKARLLGSLRLVHTGSLHVRGDAAMSGMRSSGYEIAGQPRAHCFEHKTSSEDIEPGSPPGRAAARHPDLELH